MTTYSERQPSRKAIETFEQLRSLDLGLWNSERQPSRKAIETVFSTISTPVLPRHILKGNRAERLLRRDVPRQVVDYFLLILKGNRAERLLRQGLGLVSRFALL